MRCGETEQRRTPGGVGKLAGLEERRIAVAGDVGSDDGIGREGVLVSVFFYYYRSVLAPYYDTPTSKNNFLFLLLLRKTEDFQLQKPLPFDAAPP